METKKQSPTKPQLTDNSKTVGVSKEIFNTSRPSSDIFFMFICIFIVIYEITIAMQLAEMSYALEAYGIIFDPLAYLLLIPTVSFSWALYFPIGNFLTKYWVGVLRNQSTRENETLPQRIKRCRSYLMGSIYYLSSFVFTFLVAVKVDLLPQVYGGTLDLKESQKNWPCRNDLIIKIVYMFAYGHHLERLVVHMVTHYNTPTYFTMLLHHLITVGLIAITYQSEYFPYGFAVLLLLDLSDFLLQLSRFLRETIYQRLFKVIFGLMIISWIHGRVFGLCWEVLTVVYYTANHSTEFLTRFFAVFLFCFASTFILAFLNIFWLYQILKIFLTIFILRKEKLEYEDNNINKKRI